MKKLLLIVTIGFLTISCGVKKSKTTQYEFENGWYFVTTSKKGTKPVKDRFGAEVVYEEAERIVKSSEHSKIGITKQNWGGKEYTIIELIYEGEAKLKWADATERMSKTEERAVFIYNDEFISMLSSFLRKENGYASISHENFNEEMLAPIVAELKVQKNDDGQY